MQLKLCAWWGRENTTTRGTDTQVVWQAKATFNGACLWEKLGVAASDQRWADWMKPACSPATEYLQVVQEVEVVKHKTGNEIR